MRDAGQEKIDIICREICRLQAAHDAVLNERGEHYFWTRLSLQGEIGGLRKALCLFFDWSFEEAQKEGRADEYVQAWTDSST